MALSVLILFVVATGLVMLALPVVFLVLGTRYVIRRLLGRSGSESEERPRFDVRSAAPLPMVAHKGCPSDERASLRGMERRLELTHRRSLEAIERRLPSELARARVAPPLEDTYAQIRGEIDSIYGFCERNDLAGMLRRANQSSSARDIYLQAYDRDLAKVRAAIKKTEECLTAYERTVATLEVSSVEADISSDFDASIEILRDLQRELPLYSLADEV